MACGGSLSPSTTAGGRYCLPAATSLAPANAASTDHSLHWRMHASTPIGPGIPAGNRTMGRKIEEKIASLPRRRQDRVKRRARELVSEELSLRELRRAMNLTQVEMARLLGVGQHTVSRYERRSDLLLSTLRGYVAAMGGRLALVVDFPGRRPVRIRGLGDLADK